MAATRKLTTGAVVPGDTWVDLVDAEVDGVWLNTINRLTSTAGTSTAYTASATPNLAADTMVYGTVVVFVPHVTCGASPFLNVDGIGAYELVKPDGSSNGVNISAGDLTANNPYMFEFRNTYFMLLSANQGDIDDVSAEVVAARSGKADLDERIDNVVKDTINTAPEGTLVNGDSRLVFTDASAGYAVAYIEWQGIWSMIWNDGLGPIIASTPTKGTLVDADGFVIADSAAANDRKKVTWSQLKANIAAALGVMTGNSTNKPTPDDADNILLSDSTAGNATRRTTWAQAKTAMRTTFDPIYITDAADVAASINTAPEETVIDGDSRFTFTDAVDSFLLKRVQWQTIWATIWSGLGPIIAGTGTKGVIADNDGFVIADSEAASVRKQVRWSQLKGNIWSDLGFGVSSGANKATPVDADNMLLTDSASAHGARRITWAQLKAALTTALDPATSAEFDVLNAEVTAARSGKATLDLRIDDIVKDSINAAPETAITAQDRIPFTDAEGSYGLKHVEFNSLGTVIYDGLGPVIAASSAKPTLADNDAFLVADSAVANAPKQIRWDQFRGNIATWLGPAIGGFTHKATPVDADDFLLSDSAAANATKRTSWASLKASLQAAFDPIYTTDATTVAAAINAAPEKSAIPDAARLTYTDSGASYALKHIEFSPLKTAIFDALGPVIATTGTKPTLADNDGFVIADSAAANDRKQVRWSHLRSNLATALGPGLGASANKATPADADDFLLSDSAAADATKRITWAQLKTALDFEGLVDSVEEVAAEVRDEIENLSFSLRPGRDPRLFAWIPTTGLSDAQVTAAMLGTLEAFDPIPDTMIVIDGQDGAEVRAIGATTGPGVIVLREAFRIDTDGLYKVTAKVRRRVNSTDPANDSVQVGVLALNAAQGAAVGSLMVMDTLNALTVASGRVTSTDVIATAAAAGVTLVAPAGTVYGRLYVRIWGTTGTTAVQALTVHDIAGSTYNSPDVSALEAELDALVSEDLPARVDALEASGTAPEISRFKTRANAAAATIGATVDLIEVLGNTLDTDGHVDTYQRAVGGPASNEVFQSADGSWWTRQYHSRFADFASLDAVAGAAIPAWQNEIIVARRDTGGIAFPFICRNAGLSDPPHVLFKTAADGRRFEYGEPVVNCQKIGMSPTRAATENYTRMQEAIDYAMARRAAIYLPGASAPYEINPGASSTYMLHAPGGISHLRIVGDGFGHSVIRIPDGVDKGGAIFTGIDYLSLLDFTIDCNDATNLGYHGCRLENVADAHIRLQVLDASGYGVGCEGAPYRRHWYERLDIRRAGLDGFDWKNDPDSNGDIFLGDIYIEDPNYGRADDNGAGVDLRGRFLGGNISVVFKSAAASGQGVRTRLAVGVDVGGRYTSLNNIQVVDEVGTSTYGTHGIGISDDYVSINSGLVKGVTGIGYDIGSCSYITGTNLRAIGCGSAGFRFTPPANHISLIAPQAVGCGAEGFRMDAPSNLKIVNGLALDNNYGFREVATMVNPQLINCHAENNPAGNVSIPSPTARLLNVVGYTGDIPLYAHDAIQAKLAGVSGAVNYLKLNGGLAAPSIQAEGTSANVDISLLPKALGAVRFGTHAAIAAETVTGYIVIKDAAGAARKLAVVS